MKPFSILAAFLLGLLPCFGAQVKISDLPIITSPSTNTFIEVADMDEATKSRKYLLTNLATVVQLNTDAANWVAEGTTNSTLAGVASANRLVATNGVHSVGNGTGGSFVGNPADSETWWGSSDFTGVSYIDFPSEATSIGREFYLGNYGGAVNTYGRIQLSVYTDTSLITGQIRTTGTATKQFRLGFSPSTEPHLAFGAASLDTYLYRDAANILAMRNGTAAQQFNVYNTFTDASNYEKGNIAWSGNVLFIGNAIAGTGAAREVKVTSTSNLHFRTAATDRWQVSSSGHILAGTDNTYDIGASGATRPRDIFVADDIVVGDDITANGDITGAFLNGDVIAPTFVQTADRFQWLTSSRLNAPSDGVIHISNAAENDFNRLQFGGLTASYPALKRSTTNLLVRLADDSANTGLEANILKSRLNATSAAAPTIASATTIAPTNSIVFISGTDAIETITAPAPISATGGQITLIPTGIFTTTTAGNIALASTAVVSKAMIMTYDSGTTKWYPSY